jgi:hypothetical protein
LVEGVTVNHLVQGSSPCLGAYTFSINTNNNMNYNEKLILFNQLKHLILRKKQLEYLTDHYFCENDYKFIEKIKPEIAEKIYFTLIENINNDYYGLSQETCTFCIYKKITNTRCKTCEWGKNHGLCISPDGTYKQTQALFEQNNIETITSKQYKNIINKIKKMS